MANEATVTCSLRLTVDGLVYQSQPRAFNADVSTGKGPTPGLVVATPEGTVVDLSKLTTPGLAFVRHIGTDTTIWVEIGILDNGLGIYYPMLELLAGEGYPLRLSRHLGNEEAGSSSGSLGTGNSLVVRCNTQTANVTFEAFEK